MEAAKADHMSKLAFNSKLNRLGSVPCRQNSVVCRRASAALEVSQHRDSGFQTGFLSNSAGDMFPYSAKADGVCPFDVSFSHNNFFVRSFRPFGDADNAKSVAARAPFDYLLEYGGPFERNFGDQEISAPPANPA